jgi:hypothetical protein
MKPAAATRMKTVGTNLSWNYKNYFQRRGRELAVIL